MNLWLEYGLLTWYIVVLLNSILWLLSWPASRKNKTSKLELEGVSVVICSRNAASQLSTQIPIWLKQDYPIWELIILDDHSSDGSWEMLQKWSQNPRIRVYSMAEEDILPGKKYAQRFGVNKAQFAWILVTDVDCKPASKFWMQRMMQARKKDTPVVLGVGLLEKTPGFLNRFIRYEMVHTAVQYLTAAYWNIPYMGVGRNLLFERQLFQTTEKRAGDHLPYGDDDLFVNAISSYPMTYCLHPESFTLSPAKESLSAYLDQKRRHLSTGKYYRVFHQLLLGSWAFLHFLFWLGFFAFLPFYPVPAFTVALIRFTLCILALSSWTTIFTQRDLPPWFPILDLLFLFIYFRGVGFIFWRDKTKW